MARLVCGLLIVSVAACGNITRKQDQDGGVVPDDGQADAITAMLLNFFLRRAKKSGLPCLAPAA